MKVCWHLVVLGFCAVPFRVLLHSAYEPPTTATLAAAKTGPEDERRAEETDFNAYLVKPVTPEALRSVLAVAPCREV